MVPKQLYKAIRKASVRTTTGGMVTTISTTYEPPKRVALLTFAGCSTLDIVGALDVFAEVNRQGGRQMYEVEIVSGSEGLLVGSPGITLVAGCDIHDSIGIVDTLLVTGGDDLGGTELTPTVLNWVRATAKVARRFGGISAGTFILAEAGLLTGRRVTTHWSRARDLAKLHPEVVLEPDALFICDGPVCTSAGATAGIDLALALIEEDCGRAVALTVARELLVYLKRSGGQSQYCEHLSGHASSLPVVTAVQNYVALNLTADLGVEALARRAHMSARHFARVFTEQLGVTPRVYVEGARLDAARRLLAENVSFEQTASLTGFTNVPTMRRAFLRRFMTTPAAYRSNFAGNSAPPA